MKALVIGMGISGRGAVEFLKRRNYTVVAADNKVMGEGILKDDFEIHPFDFSLVVLSPGIPTSHLLCKQAYQLGVPVIGEAELAFRFLKNRAVGITGTNGKTTLTMLTEHVLVNLNLKQETDFTGDKPKTQVFKAKSLGNVGVALTTGVDSLAEDEIVVAELSSFQLETMEQKVFDVGIITNFTPDHLDRYETMENYAAAKLRLLSCLKEGAPFYVHEEMAQYVSSTKRCRFFGPSLKIHPWMNSEILVLVERLNSMITLPTGVENILAGYLLTRTFGVSVEEYLRALATFRRPRHRMEHIATIGGVEFCNDSKATNVASVSFALDMMRGPTYLIMGGKSKKSSYASLIPKMQPFVKEIFTIGEAAEEIEEAFREHVPCSRAGTLQCAVSMARKRAQSGDLILLSPACSSYDQFKNYEDRGDQFRNLVEEIL